jgi:hypothetical protein
MIIKNEENNIKKNLWNIYDLFDDIVIFDTWSTDNSIKILGDFWIKAKKYNIQHKDKRLIDARNLSIENNSCEMVLILDWDENISREDIKKIKKMENMDWVSWYFIKWIDHRYKEPFEDYKMCLINKNYVRFLFSVHACPQIYIRDNWWKWDRLNWIELHHYPENKKYRSKYIEQLENWIKENPWCLRFYRFIGYFYFKNNDIKKSLKYLEYVVKYRNVRFPVEILNSIMILACINQSIWNSIKTYHYVSLWLEYYEEVKNDFEVKVNFRLKKWFEDSQNTLIANAGVDLLPYEFAY